MIKDLIMSGQTSNIRIVAQLMKNITEAEFMVIVNEICDDIEMKYKEFKDEIKLYTHYDRGRFEIYPNKYGFHFSIATMYVYFFRDSIETVDKKITYKQLIEKLENI